MDPFLGEIERRMIDRRLLSPGDRVVVAVSGGLDSMVLLRVLARLAPKHGWKLTVAHFNHRLRGRSSDADERMVRRIAAGLGLPTVVESADVKRFAADKKLSIEMAARELRHEFLARMTGEPLKGGRPNRAGQQGGLSRRSKVALAHHADDQVELFFLRLLRGAGSEGLSGMRDASSSPADPRITLIRPLLTFSREQLAGYAAANKIQFREDASNLCTDFQRNRIRHKVLPVLKGEQPALAATVFRSIEILSVESDFVAEAARGFLAGSGPEFDRLHIAIQRRVLQQQLHAMGVTPDFELIEKLRCHSEIPVSVAPGKQIVRSDKGKISLRDMETAMFETGETSVALSPRGKAVFGHLQFRWCLLNRRGVDILPTTNCEWFDAEKVGTGITLRYWRPGDRFQPIGLSRSAKLHDLFINAKVPREERHRRIVTANARGEIVWVEGLRISERFKLDNSTRQRLKWCWQPI